MRAVGVVRVVEQDNSPAGERNEVSAICLLEHPLIEHELRWAVGNNALCEGNDIMEALRGTGEVVRRRYNRAASGSLGIEDVHDLLLRRGVDASDRLVEQIDLRICGDRTRQEDPAALTTGEFTDLALRKIRHVNTRERIRNRCMIGSSRSTKRPKCGRTPHHHDLANRDGEAPINLLSLWHICHTLRMYPNGGTKHLNAAAPWLHQPSDALQEGRLPTAVRAEDCGERPRCKGE
jgi:hypothetical protein